MPTYTSAYPHSTTIALSATNSDNFDLFCFENLSCGFRVQLCFGYLGTVRHQHPYRSSSPRTTTNGYITLVSASPLYHLGIVIPLYIIAIALITTIAQFCASYPSRLAFEYCRQRHLCTLVVILNIAYLPYLRGAYLGIISCVTRLSSHIHNSYHGSSSLKELKRERDK